MDNTCIIIVSHCDIIIITVSQFTLYANLKGNKPDFHNAMNPTDARQFYHQFLSELRAAYHPDKIHGSLFFGSQISLIIALSLFILLLTRWRIWRNDAGSLDK